MNVTAPMIIAFILSLGQVHGDPLQPKVLLATEVITAPSAKTPNPAFQKYENPQGIHQHYVNNLFDAADEFYNSRKDVPLKERADFYSLVRTLAADEKTETENRNTCIIERKSIEVLDNYFNKMGQEKTKELLEKYTPIRISKFTELVTVKKLGFEIEFKTIIIDSLTDAVDQVELKKKKRANKAVDSTATRVTPPASSLRSGQEPRHGQP